MTERYGPFSESDVLGSNATMIALDIPESLGNFAPSAMSVLLHADRNKYYFSHVKNHPRWKKKIESLYQRNEGTWRLLSPRDDGVVLPTACHSECHLTAFIMMSSQYFNQSES